jgi:protease inhibitor Inh
MALLAACVAAPAPAPPAPGVTVSSPPEAMAGRWLLAAAGSSQCNMTFGGNAGAGEGTIAPEGGCPTNFFTSRKWTFEQGLLVIRDHTGTPLAQLAQTGSGRFEGKATDGLQMTLTR